jgi:four helix bundle protein
MENNQVSKSGKPYDLRERLLEFACDIVRVVQYLHTQGPIAKLLSEQVLKSGTSAGANYEEADDASSPRDAAGKQRIALRELKETRFRLRVIRRSGFLQAAHDAVIAENAELVKIVAKILRNAAAKDPDAKPRRRRPDDAA